MAKTTSKSPSPEEIVAKWRKRFVSRLKPWFVEDRVLKQFERKLRKRIKDVMKGGPGRKARGFTSADMRNSLRVAGDAARICKILQPAPNPKEIEVDTLQSVLRLCSTFHNVCQGGGGGGAWCDI